MPRVLPIVSAVMLSLCKARKIWSLSGNDQTRDDKSRLDVNLRKHTRGKFVESWTFHSDLYPRRRRSLALSRVAPRSSGAATRLSHFSKAPSRVGGPAFVALSRPMATASVKGHFGKACKIRGGVREHWL